MGETKERILFNVEELHEKISFQNTLLNYIDKYKNPQQEIIILCIGTDRATGDCLGPLIGHKLKYIKLPNVFIYGTLDDPVHAKNLVDKLKFLEINHPNAFIIAIDACLGKIEHIGHIGLGVGPLKPGAGVNKTLPDVGDIFITGIVNFNGVMDIIILQNTRLSLVMKMADFIAHAIKSALWKYNHFISDEFIDNTLSL